MKEVKDKNIHEFLTPYFVYIPFDNRTLLNIKLNMKIFNNSLIGKLNIGEKIYTTCSGKLINLETIETADGKMNSMVIENDFRDKKEKFVGIKRSLYNYDKLELINKLEEFSLNIFDGIENIIINVEYNKNTNITSSIMMKEYVEDYLETLDVISNNLDIKNMAIILNKKDKDSIEEIENHIGAHPEIEYLTVTKEYFKEEYDSLMKKVYRKNDKTLIITLDKLFEIYHVLKKNKNITRKLITISDENKPMIVNVKIGCDIKELLDNFNITYKEIYLENNKGLTKITGHGVITKNTTGIIIR